MKQDNYSAYAPVWHHLRFRIPITVLTTSTASTVGLQSYMNMASGFNIYLQLLTLLIQTRNGLQSLASSPRGIAVTPSSV